MLSALGFAAGITLNGSGESSGNPWFIAALAFVLLCTVAYRFRAARTATARLGRDRHAVPPEARLDPTATAALAATAESVATPAPGATPTATSVAPPSPDRADDSDTAEFLTFATMVFELVHTAQSTGNFAPVAVYLSPALMQLWAVERSAGAQPPTTFSVVGNHILSADVQGDRQVRRVWFDADTVQMVADRQVLGDEAEFWTFERSLSKATPEHAAALQAQRCPVCGATLTVNAIGSCAYCGALLTNGEFSWVVTHVGRNLN